MAYYDKISPLYSFYNAWANLKRRCTYSKHNRYHLYGGRGITYDPKWETFEGFKEDMLAGYKKGLSIDRIDNDGNYIKANCRWATVRQQALNRSTNRLITYKGITKHVSIWAKEIGLKRTTLEERLNRGWAIKDAFERRVAPSLTK